MKMGGASYIYNISSPYVKGAIFDVFNDDDKCDICRLEKLKRRRKAYKSITIGYLDINICKKHFEDNIQDEIIDDDSDIVDNDNDYSWYTDNKSDKNDDDEVEEDNNPEAIEIDAIEV